MSPPVIKTPDPRIGIIADDFTGALDAGAQFVGYGYEGRDDPWQVSFRLGGQPASEVEIINTASREIPVSAAVEKNRAAAAALAGRLLFKKIDSTMRGNIAAEVGVILQSAGYGRALICPAAPAQGRTVRDGRLYVHGVPLEQTTFKDDPVHPARSSVLADLLGVPLAHIPLAAVREGWQAVRDIMMASPASMITCDAETPGDLEQVGQAIYSTGALPCGAFGLARAFIHSLPGIQNKNESGSQAVSLKRPVLVLVGSANRVSRAQAQQAEKNGRARLLALPAEPGAQEEQQLREMAQSPALILAAQAADTIRTAEWLRFGEMLSQFTVNHIGTLAPQSLVVIGGETLAALCKFAGVESISLQGEMLPGVPLGRFHGGALDGMSVVTKAGGFGDDTTLLKILL